LSEASPARRPGRCTRIGPVLSAISASIAGVPYFFKQWGEWGPLEGSGAREPTPIGHWVEDFNAVGRRVICEAGDQAFVGGMTSRGVPHQVRVGKKAAGRELDGRTWDEMPEELESQSDSTEDSAGGAMGQVKV
jgi:protein gp37